MDSIPFNPDFIWDIFWTPEACILILRSSWSMVLWFCLKSSQCTVITNEDPYSSFIESKELLVKIFSQCSFWTSPCLQISNCLGMGEISYLIQSLSWINKRNDFCPIPGIATKIPFTNFAICASITVVFDRFLQDWSKRRVSKLSSNTANIWWHFDKECTASIEHNS